MRLIEQTPRSRSIWDDMNALSREIWGGLEYAREVSPRTDVIETAETYVMHVELPGFTDKDIDLKVKEGILTLSSVEQVVNAKETRTEEKYLLRERVEYKFQRSYRIPKDVQEDAIGAHFALGILTITLPRRPEVQPRTISIKAE